MNPWSISVVKKILQNMNAEYEVRTFAHHSFGDNTSTVSNSYAVFEMYQGYHASSKCYSGTVALSSLQKSSRNKVIEMGNLAFAYLI